MTGYEKFTKKVFLAHIIYFLIGILICFSLDSLAYVMGWTWGCMVDLIYLLFLTIHMKALKGKTEGQLVGQVRRQMGLRMLLVVVLVIVGISIPGLNPLAMMLGLALAKPFNYIVSYYLSKNI